MSGAPRAVRLAVAPIAWRNDDIAEISELHSVEQCLRESAEAGYGGTEAGRSYPRDPARLKELLDGAGLAMAAGWWSGMLRTGTVEDEIARIDAELRLYEGVGTDVMFYGEVDGSVQAASEPLSRRPRLGPEEFKPYGERLSRLAAHAQSRGVRLCFHHHMGTAVQSAEDVALLMEHSSEDLGLLVDTGHCVFAGADPAELLRRHAARVAYVHCKDLREQRLRRCVAEDWLFARAVMEGVFTVPGDGFIDFDGFLGALAGVGYAGWIVVEAEQDPRRASPKEYAVKGREHLEPLLAKHGFAVVRD